MCKAGPVRKEALLLFCYGFGGSGVSSRCVRRASMAAAAARWMVWSRRWLNRRRQAKVKPGVASAIQTVPTGFSGELVIFFRRRINVFRRNASVLEKSSEKGADFVFVLRCSVG